MLYFKMTRINEINLAKKSTDVKTLLRARKMMILLNEVLSGASTRRSQHWMALFKIDSLFCFPEKAETRPVL